MLLDTPFQGFNFTFSPLASHLSLLTSHLLY